MLLGLLWALSDLSRVLMRSGSWRAMMATVDAFRARGAGVVQRAKRAQLELPSSLDPRPGVLLGCCKSGCDGSLDGLDERAHSIRAAYRKPWEQREPRGERVSARFIPLFRQKVSKAEVVPSIVDCQPRSAWVRLGRTTTAPAL